MHDQGMVSRPSLGLENSGDSLWIERVSGQSVDRFSGQAEQLTTRQSVCRLCNVFIAVAQHQRWAHAGNPSKAATCALTCRACMMLLAVMVTCPIFRP